MRTPEEAIAEILDRIEPLAESGEVLIEQALGRVLAQEVVSDIDLPPFEKSAMDGFAVRSADFENTGSRPKSLERVGESRAGVPYAGRVAPGECVAIYTGAELPADCDAVVIVEKTSSEGTRVSLDDTPAPEQHVCHRGEELSNGARVMSPGRRLSAVDLSVLAAVGCQPVEVVRAPRVALGTSGDELLTPDRKPGPGQIREGNTLTLAARLRAHGAQVSSLGIVRDDPKVLASTFAQALEISDALVTTGGVSMGAYDWVGATFESLGVERVLHKVAIKPGKPIWFGMLGDKPVFGLPGNPVSCLLGLEVFVRPALAKLSGAAPVYWEPPLPWGTWQGAQTRAIPRQQNLPVRVVVPEAATEGGLVRLERLAWRGSADMVGLAEADGLALIPAGETVRTGELVRYRPLPRNGSS